MVLHGGTALQWRYMLTLACEAGDSESAVSSPSKRNSATSHVQIAQLTLQKLEEYLAEVTEQVTVQDRMFSPAPALQCCS